MKKSKSFTIVEIMVAMTIFALIIGAGIALIQQTLVMISIAHQRLVAYYLAQESIELARNFRDNNWIEQQKNNPSLLWYNGFPSVDFDWDPPQYKDIDFEVDYTDPYSPVPGELSLTPIPANGTNPVAPRYLALDGNGYSYDTVCLKSTSASECTKFQRYMRIAMHDGGIRIECHVKWKERNRTHYITVKEKLYNWYGN